MALTLVAEIVDSMDGTGAALATIRWDTEWDEFRVTWRGQKGSHHTDSRTDATGTGMVQSRQLFPNASPILICRRGFGTKGNE